MKRLVVLAIALFTIHCRPPQPPRLPIAPVQALALPVPAPPRDPSLVGYIKLRDPAGTLARLDESVLRNLAPEGVASLGLRPGEGAGIFLWEPPLLGGFGVQTLPLAIFLPAAQDSRIVRNLGQLWPALQVVAAGPRGQATLAGLNPAALERARSQGPVMGELLGAPTPFDGYLYLYLEPLVGKYLPILRASVGSLGPMFEQVQRAQAQQGQAPPFTGEQMAGMMGAMLDRLAPLKSFTLGASQVQGGLELGMLIEDKPGTARAGGPLAVPDLTQFLAPGAMRLQWNVRDFGQWADGYLKIYAPILASRPELKTAIDALVADWRQATRGMNSGQSFSFDKAHGLRMSGLMQVDDAAKVLALVGRMTERFSAGPIHDAYVGLGMDIRIERMPGTRKIKGWPVARYAYHVKMTKPPKDEASRVVLGLFDNLVYEVAQVGPFVLFTMGQPGGPGAPGEIDRLAEDLLHGRGRYPLAARGRYPAGGTLYCDVDVAQALEGVRSFLPPDQAAKLPTLSGGAGGPVEPVTMFSYDGGDTSYLRVQVPRKLLSLLAGSK
ncbi:MAG TPA: hypothetical protein VH877_31015 [Polyangia bacterium]|jgi:hypothetical protein|nr:hypothetical protein [Polyangia bacterium]